MSWRLAPVVPELQVAALGGAVRLGGPWLRDDRGVVAIL